MSTVATTDPVLTDPAAARPVDVVAQQRGQRVADLARVVLHQPSRIAKQAALVAVAFHAVAGTGEAQHGAAGAERLDGGGAGLR